MDREIKNYEKTDPEGHRYGNFINYYTFHPAQERIRQLPQGIWSSWNLDYKYSALDIGCNSGNLSSMLYNFLEENVSSQGKCDVSLLGVDLDPILIKRARDQNSTSKIKFECLDFLSKGSKNVLSEYLESIKRTRFDVAFCFSITMWIHLNHGDSGLVEFLKVVCEMSDMIVVEPQQWKSYRNASRRLRRANAADFPMINKLKFTGDMVMHIENILRNECNFCNVMITNENNWQRKVLIYKRKS